MGTEDVAFSRLATIGPSAADRAKLAEINLGIDATMREVIAGAKYNPNSLDTPISKVTLQGAVPVAKSAGERWVDAVPLRTPETASTDATIERMVNAALPHGAGSPLRAEWRERRPPAAEKALTEAVEAARAEAVLAETERAEAEPEPEAVANAPEVAVPVAAPKAGGTLTRRRLT